MITEGEQESGNLLPLPLALTLLLFPAPQQGEHPVPLPADFDAAKCVECHANKKEGKHIHAAVEMGCTSCHQVATEKETTKITLLAPGGELCATCHEAPKNPVIHGPYKSGTCLACHDAHASNFPRVTRAETNTLCLSCHGVNQPGIKIDRATKTVTVLGNQVLPFEVYGRATKVSLDRSGSRGHPILGHPVSGKLPGKDPNATVSCLSCHVPHSSAQKFLAPADSKNDIGLCGKCHE